MRSHAERARSSARKTDGAIPYAARNPRDTVSLARPFISAHLPISVDGHFAKSDNNRSGQSFLCLGALLEGVFQQISSLNDVPFCNSGKLVDVGQMIEPATSAAIVPVKPDQLHSCRDHLIAMAIQR